MADDAPERAVLEAVLADAADVMRGAGIPHVVIGSLASTTWGARDEIEDIDFFVREGDADRALDAFAASGFATQKKEPQWLYKARAKGVEVDLIFEVTGGLRLGDEILRRARERDVAGVRLPLVSPEDLVVILAISTQPETAKLWHTAVEVLRRSTPLEWPYLVELGAPWAARVGALLLYARSVGVSVPGSAVEDVCRLALREPGAADGLT